jgi:hypothetical protein
MGRGNVKSDDSSQYYVSLKYSDESSFFRSARESGESAREALAALRSAVAVLLPAVEHFADALRMLARRVDGDAKYTSLHRSLTAKDIERHLQGSVVHGSGLSWPDPLHPGRRLCRALAWDSDTDLDVLLYGAASLDAVGLRPLLVRNPTKPSCGHLWLFLDAPLEPIMAMARAEYLAPALRKARERFPDGSSNGGRIRLPGGCYLPINGKPVAVRVAAGRQDMPLVWLDGTIPLAWALIGCAVSQAGILTSTWLPPSERPQFKPVTVAPIRKTVRPANLQGSLVERVQAWSAANPVTSLVSVKHNKFVASWRRETVASVHYYDDDGHWWDYGGKFGGRDSFDLYCRLNGYWDEGSNKPRRVEAARALGILPEKGAGQ